MFLKKFSDFILFSSIFIALCAVALCMETNIILHLPLNIFSFYFFVFGATLLQYNLHYLIKPSPVLVSGRHVWSAGKKNIHAILVAAGAVCILFSFIHFRLHHLFIISIFGFVAFIYSFPVIPFSKKKRLKDFGIIKIITLALMWTIVTVWFPVLNLAVGTKMFVFIFLQRLSFMLVICLLFDLRDMQIDTIENIRTIAVRLGKKGSRTLSYFFLIIFIIISAALFHYSGNVGVFAAMLCSALPAFVIVYATKKILSDLFYLSCVDGLMLLQAILIYLFAVKF